MIDRRALCAQRAGRSLLLDLRRGWFAMLLRDRPLFLGRGLPRDSAPAAGVGRSRAADIIRRLPINIRYTPRAEIVDRGVVAKRPTIPESADEADAEIAEPVIDSAVVADVRPPISRDASDRHCRRIPNSPASTACRSRAAAPRCQEPSNSPAGPRTSSPGPRDSLRPELPAGHKRGSAAARPQR